MDKLEQTTRRPSLGMAFEDLTLQCVECGGNFEFSAGEQEFYQTKGLVNTPKPCP